MEIVISTPPYWRLFSFEIKQRGDFDVGRKCVASVETLQSAQEIDVNGFWIHHLHELVCGEHSAAGGEQIVVNDHHIIFGDGIAVHLNHETNIGNLFAIGECASMYHGANRLG